MNYRKLGKTDLEVSVLGLGCLKFLGEDGNVVKSPEKAIDEASAIKIIHAAIEQGINYFDTAYIYLWGKSEEILGKALKGETRSKVIIADKLPVWLAESGKDFEKMFNQQLQRLGTDYIDVYLLHGLSAGNWRTTLNLDALKFLEKIVADGRARYIGFSFHDDLQLFKTIVDAYDWSLCQIQLNYLDKNNQAGLKGLKYAADKGMGVVIMEPLRGGELAGNQPKEVDAIWNGAEVKRTPVDWALRWLWNHPEISCVLSGMNSMGQLDENIRIACDVKPGSLTLDELALYDRVFDVYRRKSKVGCTGCTYCMPCPAGVDIPLNFSIYNQLYMFENPYIPQLLYFTQSPGKRPENCKECGICESHCPQKLPIRKKLKEVYEEFKNRKLED